MGKHVVLKIYAVETSERALSISKTEERGDYVTLEFDGELKKKTRDAVEAALATGGYQIRFKKKVLA